MKYILKACGRVVRPEGKTCGPEETDNQAF